MTDVSRPIYQLGYAKGSSYSAAKVRVEG